MARIKSRATLVALAASVSLAALSMGGPAFAQADDQKKEAAPAKVAPAAHPAEEHPQAAPAAHPAGPQARPEAHPQAANPAPQRAAEAPAAHPVEHAQAPAPHPTEHAERAPTASEPRSGASSAPAAARPTYHIDQKVTVNIRQHFSTQLQHVDRSNRPNFVIGATFPHEYVTQVEPVSADLLVGLPPLPPGYVAGYYDGYVVVYDPVSFAIIEVVDLTAA